MLKLKWLKITFNRISPWSWNKNIRGGDHILIQFLTLQISNFTMTQNLLNRVHSISANHLEYYFTLFDVLLSLQLYICFNITYPNTCVYVRARYCHLFIWVFIGTCVNKGIAKVPISSKIRVRVQGSNSGICKFPTSL